MEIVKSNIINLEPFQLWYCGMIKALPVYTPITIYGVPLANMFTLYVNVGQSGLQHFSLNKGANQKWTASTLSTV